MKMKRVCVCVFDRTNQVADNFDGCETVAKFDARSKKKKETIFGLDESSRVWPGGGAGGGGA